MNVGSIRCQIQILNPSLNLRPRMLQTGVDINKPSTSVEISLKEIDSLEKQKTNSGMTGAPVTPEKVSDSFTPATLFLRG